MPIHHLPSLQALRALEAAIRLQSYTAAATELGLTHGAISRQVDALTLWVGVPLFVRVGRRMRPTERALALVTQTREALHLLGDAFGHPLLARAVSGLRLSTTPAIARLWLLPRLPSILAAHPGLIAAIETSAAHKAGWDTNVDAAVRYGPGDWAGLRSIRLGGERLGPVAAPAILSASADWRTLPFITTPFQTWRSWFNAVGEATPQHFKSSIEFPDAALALDAAQMGIGVALGRMKLAEAALQSGKVVVADARMVDDLYGYFLVWPIASAKAEQIESLANLLTEAF